MDELKAARPNYEALYSDALCDFERERASNDHLREMLRLTSAKIAYYEGMQHTLEIIFGKEFPKFSFKEL